MIGLPAFFQSNIGGTALLDELTNFELEGVDQPSDLLDSIIDDVPLDENINEDTFTNAFGDFNPDSLPEYLQNTLITPGRSAVPDLDDGDIDIAEILNKSTAERLKDQAAALAISKALGNPSLIAKSASKLSSAPPGLPPGLTPPPSDNKLPSFGMSSSLDHPNGSFSSPLANRGSSSNPPGLLPIQKDLSSNFQAFSTPPPLTPKEVPSSAQSVVSSILSPPPKVVEGSPAPFFSPKPNFGRGKYMHPSDVRFVVSKVLQPLETLDPYADDFYFIQVEFTTLSFLSIYCLYSVFL